MSLETTLQTNIINYLKLKGALVDNIQGNEFQSSIADLLICYRGRYIALEVKGPNGVLRPGQQRKLLKVQKAGGIGEVVYGLNKVKDIIKTIDEEKLWDNSTY
jgi:hypothetical protein